MRGLTKHASGVAAAAAVPMVTGTEVVSPSPLSTRDSDYTIYESSTRSTACGVGSQATSMRRAPRLQGLTRPATYTALMNPVCKPTHPYKILHCQTT